MSTRNDPLVLCLDTVFPQGSLALLRGQHILVEKFWARGFSHAEQLTSQIQITLAEIKADVQEIQSILIDHGPGSFTGVRIGITCARTLGFAIGAKILPLSSLETLAWQGHKLHPEARFIATACNAHQEKVYFAVYEYDAGNWYERLEPSALRSEQVFEVLHKICGTNPILTLGDGWLLPEMAATAHSARFIEDANARSLAVKASHLWELFHSVKSTKKFLVWDAALPLYLRAPGAEERR